MKKFIVLTGLLGLISLPLTVLADPTPIVLSFECPNTDASGPTSLSNYSGARIAGYGILTVGDNLGRPPYFTYEIPPGAHIPDRIHHGDYESSGTDYDPENAIVACSYSSSTYDSFTVKYQLTNGAGGTVKSKTSNTIKINQFVGLHK